MNRLQLCQKLNREAGWSGTGPTTTLSQSGDYLKIVEWVDDSYADIQNMHYDWRFLQESFSFNLTVGKQDYTPAEAGITDLAVWKITQFGDARLYLTATTDEQYLDFMPWDKFRQSYLFGSNRSSTNRPFAVSISPENKLYFNTLPQSAFTCVGEYFKVPDVMEADADEPIIPDRFQMAIVYRALMFYGAFDAANEKYAHGMSEFKRMIRKMEIDQLPKPMFGAPLV
jgi:hypothetical protein